MVLFPAIVDQDQARNHRRRRDAIIALNDRLDAVCSQYFESRALGSTGNCMCIFPHEEGAIDSIRAAVLTDRLSDRENMRFGECRKKRGAAVAARSELDALRRIVYVWDTLVKVALELPHVDEHVPRCRFARKRRHSVSYLCCLRHRSLTALDKAPISRFPSCTGR